jgi:hypothetical protein
MNYPDIDGQRLVIEWFDTQHGKSHRVFEKVEIDSLIFANGVLQFEQDVDNEVRIQNFVYHGPFNYYFE